MAKDTTLSTDCILPKKIPKQVTAQSNQIKEITVTEDLPKSHKRIEGINNNNNNNNNNNGTFFAVTSL
jgi:hypothetical protein